MTLELYVNYSDKKYFNKNLQFVGSIEATIKTPTTLENPSFTLNTDLDFNYIKSGKYAYFVNTKTKVLGGLLQIDCEIDPLETVKPYLANKDVLVSRNEYDFDADITDGRIEVSNGVEIGNILIGTVGSGSDFDYYLNVVGE